MGYMGGGRNFGGGDAGHGGTAQGTSQSGHSGGYGRGSSGRAIGRTGSNGNGYQGNKSKSLSHTQSAINRMSADRSVAQPSSFMGAPRSMYSTNPNQQRTTVSNKTYGAMQRNMFSGLQNRARNGTLTGDAGRVLAGYNKGLGTGQATSALAQFGGLAGLAATQAARSVVGAKNLGGLGFSNGFTHGSALSGASQTGSALGASIAGPLGGFLGGIAGNALGNSSVRGALGLGDGRTGFGHVNFSGGSSALSNHQGMKAGGGGRGSVLKDAVSKVTKKDPGGKSSKDLFDWGQWSHLYTPQNVHDALTRPLTKRV